MKGCFQRRGRTWTNFFKTPRRRRSGCEPSRTSTFTGRQTAVWSSSPGGISGPSSVSLLSCSCPSLRSSRSRLEWPMLIQVNSWVSQQINDILWFSNVSTVEVARRDPADPRVFHDNIRQLVAEFNNNRLVWFRDWNNCEADYDFFNWTPFTHNFCQCVEGTEPKSSIWRRLPVTCSSASLGLTTNSTHASTRHTQPIEFKRFRCYRRIISFSDEFDGQPQSQIHFQFCICNRCCWCRSCTMWIWGRCWFPATGGIWRLGLTIFRWFWRNFNYFSGILKTNWTKI